MPKMSIQKQLKEIWTRVPGYPDYRVSIYGKVKRIKTAGGRQGNSWKAGRIKKPQSNGKYHRTSLYGKRGEKQIYIHSLKMLNML